MTNLQKLRDLLEAATPGRWAIELYPNDGYIIRTDTADLALATNLDDYGFETRDAQLIVAMRNCFAELLDVVEAASRVAPLTKTDNRTQRQQILDAALTALNAKLGESK